MIGGSVMPMGVDHCTCPSAWYGVYPPPPCSYCRRWQTAGFYGPHPQFVPVQAPAYTPLTPQPLSDDDVRRIADEVVRRMKGGAA